PPSACPTPLHDALPIYERTLELETAIKARSRLYSAMNHELRTPISAIMLYQELLLEETLGPLTGEQHRALNHSHTAALHLLDLRSEEHTSELQSRENLV